MAAARVFSTDGEVRTSSKAFLRAASPDGELSSLSSFGSGLLDDDPSLLAPPELLLPPLDPPEEPPPELPPLLDPPEELPPELLPPDAPCEDDPPELMPELLASVEEVGLFI